MVFNMLKPRRCGALVVMCAAVAIRGAVVVEIVVYQAVENYYLSPHIRQKTMEPNAGSPSEPLRLVGQL